MAMREEEIAELVRENVRELVGNSPRNSTDQREILRGNLEAALRGITPTGDFDVQVSEIVDGVAHVDIGTTDPVFAELLQAMKEESE